jgi:hypothetical protein
MADITPTNRQWAEAFTAACEEVWRERYPAEAAKPGGLVFGFMKVMTNDDDRQESVRRAKIAMQQKGLIV